MVLRRIRRIQKKKMFETQEVILVQTKPSDRNIPKVVKWKGENMVRKHSFIATIKEILEVSKELDVVRIGIIGNQHTGKSTLAEAIAHQVHKLSTVPFAVRIFDREQLLNFQNTLQTLQPANYVMVFDDVSFLGADASKKQIEMVKQATTVIRHLPGGHDVKIIIIMNYHYTLGLDKYLRQADFRYFTSVGSSEIENMERIVGNKYMPTIRDFQKMYQQALVKKHFTMRIGPKEPFSYKYRNPFIPVLFYNNNTLRLIVSPTRQWLDKICSVCAEANGTLKQSEISVQQFKTESDQKFGPGVFEAAVKLTLFQNGMNVYANSVVAAQRYLSRALEKKQISLEELAVIYGFEITRTRLRKKLDGVLADDQNPKN